MVVNPKVSHGIKFVTWGKKGTVTVKYCTHHNAALNPAGPLNWNAQAQQYSTVPPTKYYIASSYCIYLFTRCSSEGNTQESGVIDRHNILHSFSLWCLHSTYSTTTTSGSKPFSTQLPAPWLGGPLWASQEHAYHIGAWERMKWALHYPPLPWIDAIFQPSGGPSGRKVEVQRHVWSDFCQ